MSQNNLNPHDHFFRSMMKNQKVVREFFVTHLPDNIKNIVDLDKLQLDHTSYVSEDLREQISDLLFKTAFNGSSGYIYILVEHQSKPEKFMPFRMLKYMMAIMDDHLKFEQNNTLPIIYPMIFYSGAKPYNYSTDLFDLFENRELASEIFWQPCQLIDISKISDNQLNNLLWYGTIAQVMRDIHKYKKDVLLLLEPIMEKLGKIDKLGDFSYINTVMRYCFVVGEVPDKNKFREIIQHSLNQSGDEVMSFAEQLRTEGYQKGILAGITQGREQGMEQGVEQGIERGKIEVATKLLQHNSTPATVAEITGLPLARILELQKTIKNLSS